MGWKIDPRIPKAAQVDGPEFYVPTVFDRGHMVRRLDPVWGTEGPARLANADTHHYTNSCPQVHRTLETEKRGAPVDVRTRYPAKSDGIGS
jgi:DNA/RNA endonuclease G (NUC1)